MAGSHRGRKLVIAYAGEFKQQTAFDTALASADIDTRHPQNAPAYPGRTVTREQVRDCSGEYLIREDITSRLSRLTFSFDADAKLIAGWMAYAQGLAGAPSGTQTAEIWRLTVTGTLTLGNLIFEHTFQGITDSVEIPYDSTADEIKALLETLRTVKKGNITSVTGTLLAGPVNITLGGKLAAGDLSEPTVDDSGLTGGTVAVSTPTPGASKTTQITRTTEDQTPWFSLIAGFEGDTTDPDKYKNCVVESVTIRGAVRGKVTVELTILGSADVITAVGYTLPECADIEPIYTRDCSVVIDGSFVSENLREFTYTYNNNIFQGDDAFPYDDVDIVRLEHGDRTSQFTFVIYGSKGDTVYNLAEIEDIVPVRLLVGPPVERVEVNAPLTSLRLSDDILTFTGEAGRSAMNVTGVPFYDKDTAGTPDKVIYYGPSTVQLLGT